MIKKHLTFILLSLTFCSLHAQIDDVHRELLKIGLENNHSIREAALEIEKQNKLVQEVRASGLPDISANIKTTKYFEMPTVIIPGNLLGQPQDLEGSLGKPYNFDAGINLSQLLFSMPYLYGLKTAKSSVELFHLLKIKSEEDVIFQISLSYYNYIISQNNLALLYDNLKLISENQKTTQSLIDNQMALPTDLYRLDIKAIEIENQINTLKTLLQEQEYRMLLLIGDETYSFQKQNASPIPLLSDGMLPMNFENRSEIDILKQQVWLSELKVKSAKANYYPTLAAFGNYTYNAQRDEFNYFSSDEPWNKSSLLGLKLSVPIISGGKRHAQVSQAKIDYAIAQNQLDQAKVNFIHEQKVALLKYQSILSNGKALQEAIEKTEITYNTTFSGYKEGRQSLTDVLIANSELNASKLKYTNNLLDLYIAQLNLYKTTGQLKTLINN